MEPINIVLQEKTEIAILHNMETGEYHWLPLIFTYDKGDVDFVKLKEFTLEANGMKYYVVPTKCTLNNDEVTVTVNWLKWID